MEQVHILDLNFQSEESIAAFLVPSDEGLVLVETGPESTWQHLEQAVRECGYRVEDIKHVLLTHIHFDHAGAAWKLAENGATIYVHPSGLPHLADPEKLWHSASQIYGDDMERLWGKMKPIAMDRLQPVDDGAVIRIGALEFKVWYTPGHAVHHNAYQLGDVVFTGDVAGVKIEHGPIQPPCPPPDINIELWLQSIQKLKSLNATALYLTHFGRQENVVELLDGLEDVLKDWSSFILPYFQQGVAQHEVVPLFEAYTKGKLTAAGLAEHEVQRYQYANPAFMSVTGLYRYWKLKSQGRL